jgi:pimeloyl-ACP methyl ester carboxylesterase
MVSFAMQLPATSSSARVAGCDLRYTRVGTGRPVVLLHTLRTQVEYFAPLIEQLDTTRMEAIAVDLPGHGGSSAPSVDYTAGYFTDAVEGILDVLDVYEAVVAGDSIGGSIALGLAARGNPRITHVVSVNPYDYGRYGGIRRSSTVANAVFTSMLWPGVGSVVARSGTRGILRRIMEGGLHDTGALPVGFVDQLLASGSRPGHARALRSLTLHWRTWLAARSQYPAIHQPVTLVYGTSDWSHTAERQDNAQLIPTAHAITIERCGHFASMDRPDTVATLLAEIA